MDVYLQNTNPLPCANIHDQQPNTRAEPKCAIVYQMDSNVSVHVRSKHIIDPNKQQVCLERDAIQTLEISNAPHLKLAPTKEGNEMAETWQSVLKIEAKCESFYPPSKSYTSTLPQ